MIRGVYHLAWLTGVVFLCLVPPGPDAVWMSVLLLIGIALACVGVLIEDVRHERAARTTPRGRLLVAIALCLLLVGCPRWLVRDGIPAQCDAICFVPCKSEAKWEGDPNSAAAWDQLAGETLPASREETRTCEVRRKACVQCLQRLDKQRVIDLGGAK